MGYCLSDFKPLKPYKRQKNLSDQLLDFLKTLGMEPALTYTLTLDPVLESMADILLPQGPKYIGLAVGAGMRVKCWPQENYHALARFLKEKGFQPVVILGPQEADWVVDYQQNLPEALYPLQDPRIHQQSPLLTIALAKRLTAAVANDCGIGHMIAAANTPLMTLFGPTTAEKFAPSVSKSLILNAQDFGGKDMNAIPLRAVEESLDQFLKTL